MSTTSTPTTLFEELASLFASGPTPQAILEFQPSEAAINRARELLDLNRNGELDTTQQADLDQYEQVELLMRLVKSWIRAQQC